MGTSKFKDIMEEHAVGLMIQTDANLGACKSRDLESFDFRMIASSKKRDCTIKENIRYHLLLNKSF